MTSTLPPKTIRVDLRDLWVNSVRGRPQAVRQLLLGLRSGDHMMVFVDEPVACSEAEALSIRRVASAAREAGARLTVYPPTGRPMAVVTS